jgi:hypothetical protein
MKISLTTFFLLTFVQFSFGQQWGLNQYFDGADTSYSNSIMVELDTSMSNIWQIGPPQKAIFDSATTFPNVIVTDTINFYPQGNTSTFRIKLFNQWSYGILALQWKQKLDIDTTFDGGIVEYSIDQGATWQNAFNNPYVYNFYGFQAGNLDTLNTGEYAFNGTDSTWRDIWLCFDLSWMSTSQDTMNFRFTFKSDSIENNKEGWMIDNMLGHITMIHTVKNINQTNYLTVYPNPSSSIVNIEAEKLQQFHIIEHMELVNLQGIVVEKWQNLPTKFWFDTSKYADGNYLLKIKTNFKSETIHLIINKH